MYLLLLACLLFPARAAGFCDTRESCTYQGRIIPHLNTVYEDDDCTKLQCQDGQMRYLIKTCGHAGPQNTCTRQNFAWWEAGNEYRCEAITDSNGAIDWAVQKVAPVYANCSYGGQQYTHLQVHTSNNKCVSRQCQDGRMVVHREGCRYNDGCYILKRTLKIGNYIKKCVREGDSLVWRAVQPQTGRRGCTAASLKDGQVKISDNGCSRRQCQNGEMVVFVLSCKFAPNGKCYNNKYQWLYNNVLYSCTFTKLPDHWQGKITVVRGQKCTLSGVTYGHLQTVADASGCVVRQCQDGKFVLIKEGCLWLEDNQCHPLKEIWTYEGRCYQCQKNQNDNGGFSYEIVISKEKTRECDQFPCQQICTNTYDGHRCSCKSGFVVSEADPSQCVDINECSASSLNQCEQLCVNTLGSHRCACYDGYDLVNGRCQAIATCEQSSCEQICQVREGNIQCSCRAGYQPDATDPNRCVDINECLRNPCDQLCVNTEGSFICHCRDGYVKSEVDNTKCQVIVQCTEEADIIFVLDASGSLGDYYFSKELSFASKLTTHFQLGSSGARFGAVLFSTTASKRFDLNTYTQHDPLSQAIESLPYLTGVTYIDRAFDLIREDQLFGFASGGRSAADDIVILITDGQATDFAKAVTASQQLQDQGVTILAVGMGNAVSRAQLEAMVASPDDVFLAENFEELDALEKRLSETVCLIPRLRGSTEISQADAENLDKLSLTRDQVEASYDPQADDNDQ